MKPRVAVGGIWHETNTFASGKTYYTDFSAFHLVRKNEIADSFSNTNTELGGIIHEAVNQNVELIPTFYAAAVPSAIIEHETAITLSSDLADLIEKSGQLDGLILVLHGAAVAEDILDFDGYVLKKIRNLLGPSIPVIATFDYHANISDCMVEHSSILIGYDTYPHTDMADRGSQAVKILLQILETGQCPSVEFRRIPLLTTPLDQQTDKFPMSDVMQLLHDIETEEKIVCGSVAMGFPYSDVPHLGASVLIYGKNSSTLKHAADTLAYRIWQLRSAFETQAFSVHAAVRHAQQSEHFPVILVEAADNVGGGSAGDGTEVLQALLQAKVRGSVIVMADPEAVQVANQFKTDQNFKVEIGGKTDNLHGPSVEATCTLKRICDGNYVHKGTYMSGSTTSMGKTVLVESEGVKIVITSLRTMPFDAEQLRCVGIEPSLEKVIVVKSAIAWKAAFGEFAKKCFIVDTPGACPINLRRLTYKHRPTPLYPFESKMRFMEQIELE